MLRLFASTLIFLVSGTALAGAARCDGCNFNGYASTAVGLGSGTHYVSDVVNERLRKYQVTGFPLVAEPLSISAAEQDDFELILEALAATGGATKVTYPLTRDSFLGNQIFGNTSANISAFDILYNQTLRNNVGVDLANSVYGNGGLSDAIQAVSSVLFEVTDFFGIDFEAIYVIEWPDGSKTTFVIKKDSVERASIVPGRNYDSAGNILPDGAVNDEDFWSQLLGTVQFDYHDEMTEYLLLADQAGVEITTGDAGGGLRCVWREIPPGKLELRCEPV